MRQGTWIVGGAAAVLAACGGWAADAQGMSRLDAAGSLLGTVQKVAANARLRQTVGGLSVPLAYESAAGPIDAGNGHDPRNFDVAGVRLGMSPDEVAAALGASGFTMKSAGRQPSYDSAVRERWNSAGRTGTGPALFIAAGSSWERPGQEVQIKYTALPQGPRVDWVAYSGDAQRMSAEAFEDQLRRKYGDPVNGDADEQRWCTLKAPECEDPRQADYPAMEASAQYRRIWLSGHDKDRDAALQAREEADIASGKPAEIGASF